MFITPSFSYNRSQAPASPSFSGKYDKPMAFVRAGHPEDKLTLGQTSKAAAKTPESGSFSRQEPAQDAKSPILLARQRGDRTGLGLQRSTNATASKTKLETPSQENLVTRPRSPGIRDGIPLPGTKNIHYQ